LIFLTAFVGGCRKKAKEEEKPVFALVPKSIGQIYWTACRRGMEKAAKEENVGHLFTGPTSTDIVKQIDIIENLLLKGVAGIAISPNDPTAVIRVINRAIDRGVPVVTFDSDSPESKRLAYIGTDNEAAGRTAGETLAKLMEEKGKVAILTGGLGALNLNQRIKGFRDALKNYPDMQALPPEPDDDDSEKARAIAENLLLAHPDLGGFFGVSAPGAPGAARAVKAANKVGKVKIVGFDDTPECRQLIQEGVVQATVAQRPFDMGYQAIKVLFNAHKGKKPENKIMDTGVLVITRDNLKATEQKYE
jgi:ribose transport system substrate-binding protein